MNKYVKKPIEVQAIQFVSTIDSANAILAWLGSYTISAERKSKVDVSKGITVQTAKGEYLSLLPGDWLIKQNDTDFYPCSDEVFKQNYTQAPSTWLDRVKLEQARVQKDLDALDKTLDVERKPDYITDEQWIYMTRQQFHMRQYNQILKDRIANAI